jgi:hypothetical protein
MRTIYGYGLVGLLAGLLVACSGSSHDFQYWLEHPEQLEKAVGECNAPASQTGALRSDCATLNQTLLKMHDMILPAINDRQAFGQKILHAEMQLAQYQAALNALKEAASAEGTSTQEARIKTLEGQIKQQKAQIKLYLTVIKLEGIG